MHVGLTKDATACDKLWGAGKIRFDPKISEWGNLILKKDYGMQNSYASQEPMPLTLYK